MGTPQAMRTSSQPARDADRELLSVDDRLHEEMQRLAAINQELLGNVRPDSQEAFDLPRETDELTLLRGANAELRARVEELEQALQAAAPTEESWSERQKEYESLLEEKSEVIRSLHLKYEELKERGASPAESATDVDDVASLKKAMAEQRRQLEDDEESLMQQMRQMEMAMSKDRAELARQRNELQRLHNELNHEIEIASRDPGLRERLVALQRLQGEITGRKKTDNPPTPKASAATVPPTPAPANIKNSGLFRRIFGK